MKVYHIVLMILIASVAFFSAVSAVSPGEMTRVNGPRFLCESTMPTASCEDRYGNRAGTYEAIHTAYRGNKDYIDVKGE